MKEDLFNIIVTDTEKRIIIKALTNLRNNQILEQKNHDFLDDLIVRTCDAQMSKGKIKRNYEER